MKVLALLIGFIPIAFSIFWCVEVVGRAKEECYAPGFCGSLFLFIAGAGLIGTLNSVFAGSLNVPTFVLFLATAALSAICFFVWRRRI